MDKDKCQNCRFFRKLDMQEIGQCFRYPPTPFMITSKLGTPQVTCYFPVVQKQFSCGEFVLSVSLAN